MKKVLLIERAHRFSPNSVEKDRLILQAVGDNLQKDFQVDAVSEEHLSSDENSNGLLDETDYIMTMGRLPETLRILQQQEEKGKVVINPASALLRASRSYIDHVLREKGFPLAPLTGEKGFWLKRGDLSAQSEQDVQYAANEEECRIKLESFHQRGVQDVVITAHVPGDLVKFYGVAGTDFFRYYYPTDDRDTKFNDEQKNGMANHFRFDVEKARQTMGQAATVLDIPVYGGDMIVRGDGTFAMIDFNDWPSYSRCREEAAQAIASLVFNLDRKK